MAWQQQALERLIQNAYERVPYYQQQFTIHKLVDATGKIHFDRFTELPPLTRETIREYTPSLISNDIAKRKRIIKLSTGGTTGDPISPYADLQYWDWYLAATYFFYEWMGLKLGMPYLYFWGAPQDLGLQGYNLKSKIWVNLIQNRHVLNCRALSEEIMARFITEMNQMPHRKHMVACVNELYDLACFSLDNKLPITHPFEGILVTTAALTEEMRQTIQSVFHGPVYSRYGSREAGDIASECFFQDGLHINPLFSYIEIVDDEGKPVPPGIEGRILITDLHNDVMPLIRYEVQDMGILREYTPCLCGRHWDTFEQITGRLHERLILPNGATFGKVFLHYPMDIFTDLRAYQIHQLAPDTIEVHLVSPDPNYLETHQYEIQESHHRFQSCTQNMLKVSYHQVAELEKAPSGKRLVIINKIKTSQASASAQRPEPSIPTL